jgi:hypothetical protein
MSRLGIIGIGSTLALFVYLGATATDTRVGALSAIVQSALEADMEWEWFDGQWFVGFGPGLLEIPAAITFLLLLFGGLPLAGMTFSGVNVDMATPRDWAALYFLGYLGFQLVMGFIAIPVWRRLVVYPTREPILQT